ARRGQLLELGRPERPVALEHGAPVGGRELVEEHRAEHRVVRQIVAHVLEHPAPELLDAGLRRHPGLAVARARAGLSDEPGLPELAELAVHLVARRRPHEARLDVELSPDLVPAALLLREETQDRVSQSHSVRYRVDEWRSTGDRSPVNGEVEM